MKTEVRCEGGPSDGCVFDVEHWLPGMRYNVPVFGYGSWFLAVYVQAEGNRAVFSHEEAVPDGD